MNLWWLSYDCHLAASSPLGLMPGPLSAPVGCPGAARLRLPARCHHRAAGMLLLSGLAAALFLQTHQDPQSSKPPGCSRGSGISRLISWGIEEVLRHSAPRSHPVLGVVLAQPPHVEPVLGALRSCCPVAASPWRCSRLLLSCLGPGSGRCGCLEMPLKQEDVPRLFQRSENWG